MAFNLPLALQSLGAMATAFADPGRSLLMSQNVFSQMQAAEDRKRRQEEQLRRLEEERRRWEAEQSVREGRLTFHQNKFAAEQQAAEQQRAGLQNYLAQRGGMPTMAAALPGFGDNIPGVYSGGTPGARYAPAAMSAAAEQTATGMPALPQVQRAMYAPQLAPSLFDMQRPPPPPGFGPPPGAQRRRQPAQQEQAAQGESASLQEWQGRMAQAYATGNPDVIAFEKAMKPPAPLVRMQIQNEAEEKPRATFSPIQGEAEKGKMFLYDGNDQPVVQWQTHPGTGQRYPMHVQVDKAPDELGSDATKIAGLVQSALQDLRSMEEINAEMGEDWDLLDRGFYWASAPNTKGGAYKKYHDNAIDTRIRLATGAQATSTETAKANSVYGHSLFAGPAERQRQRIHLQNSVEAYANARRRLDIPDDRPLPADVKREADATANKAVTDAGFRPFPTADQFERPDAKWIGYDERRNLLIYEKDGKKFAVRRSEYPE